MFCTKFFRFGSRSQSAPKTTGAAEIVTDVPIRLLSQDLLRRSHFADRIAIILSERSLEEGRVFAIRGAWGTGKTSVKNLVVEHLSLRPNAADWMDFNPWQWGDTDAISKALFQQVADKIGGPLSTGSRRRAAKLRQYGAALTGSVSSLKQLSANVPLMTVILANVSVVTLAASIGWSLPEVTTIAKCITVISVIAPFIGWALQFFGKDPWAAPLEKVRTELEHSLREATKPLIIFVDDIDRLEPEQIRSLIRQIKVNANLPNIVFVLLFQPSIVEQALNPVANQQGREFLKKIIHGTFDLPAVPRSVVHKIMTEELDRLMGNHAVAANGFDEVRWGNALVGAIQPYIDNLRDARRYICSVAIHLPLHTGERALEVNVIDFLVLEALRVFEPDIHSAILGHQELFLQSSRFNGDRANDINRDRLNGLVASLGAVRQPIAETAIKELFPKTEWAFGGVHYGDDWPEAWNSTKRVCSLRHFSRYFELQTPIGEMSENEFSDLIAVSREAEKLKAWINDLEKRELLASVASRLDDGVNQLPIENAPVLMPAMFVIAQKLVNRNAEPFGSPWTSAWRAIYRYIGRLPKSDRGALTLEAFKATGALSVAAVVIHLSDLDPDKVVASGSEPKLDQQVVLDLKAEWVRQIGDRAKDVDALLEDSDLGSLLYRWRDYAGSIEEPRKWAQDAISSDQRLLKLLAQLMTTGTSYRYGDRVSRNIDNIRLETVEHFIGVDLATKRIEKITPPNNERQKRALEAFKRALAGKGEVE
ncbi:KAP family P-loop NTPase fold protein [Agrobacterium vitis]|uniref:NTPase n=1 Tax=Agrobacterium vitis TaxID=373 RepID=A0A7K1RC84_AGRVI|nr:P-loop NTPase fold protein [Agrobacterium vitis]MVA55292.1 NTPase [Agrobacterium vitis]